MSKVGELACRIRQNGAKLAVFNAVRQLGKATAPEIESTKVEFSKPTVLKYLGELASEGLIIEEGRAASLTGRPPKLFSINASAAFAVGIDFGAPDLTFALIDLAKNIIDKKKISTRLEESPSNTAKQIVAGIREIAHANGISPEDQLLGTVVGVPCCIDRDAELILPIPRLSHWENVPLKAVIERDAGFPVYVGMGTHLMVLGERTFGGEEEIKNMIYIHIREGIGMGALVDGKLLKGSKEAACEIGHTIVSPGGSKCVCGRRGCLEVFASEPAMLERAQSLMKRKLTTQAFFAAVKKGDTTAQKVVDEALDYLAVAIVNVVELFDPKLIVLGGNIVQGGDFAIQSLSKKLEEFELNCLDREIRLQFSKLGIYAGALGAASFAIERAFELLSIQM